jgi:hypothetical protein
VRIYKIELKVAKTYNINCAKYLVENLQNRIESIRERLGDRVHHRLIRTENLQNRIESRTPNFHDYQLFSEHGIYKIELKDMNNILLCLIMGLSRNLQNRIESRIISIEIPSIMKNRIYKIELKEEPNRYSYTTNRNRIYKIELKVATSRSSGLPS